MADATTISKTVFFNATRETVWSFLTNKNKLATWFHTAESDLTEGQDYTLSRIGDDGTHVRQIWGKVLKTDPPSLLSYTFVVGPFNGAETTVTWRLEEVAGGTRLSLKHEGIAEAAGAEAMTLLMALDRGWDLHLADFRQAVA